jgi:hypothetical protein
MKHLISGLVLGLTLSTSAVAHHSFAMFDNTKDVVLNGVAKEFQWTNPHTWIQVVVKDASGKEVEWSIEGGSPNGLRRSGWSRTSIKPGDKLSLIVHPLKDGTPGGSLSTAMVNGEPIGKLRE